jgi:hypothetical protein
METKTKVFDAVEESRKWRESTSRKLDAMSVEDRLAYLNAVSERQRARFRGPRKSVPAKA